MIRFCTARTGEACASYEGRYLHSRYSPRSEAERYFARSRPEAPPSAVLVLEPGCGYLSSCVYEAFPDSTIAELHFRPEFSYRCNEEQRFSVWTPESGQSLHDFLYSLLEDFHIANLEILNWEPARRVMPEQYGQLAASVMAFIRERNASITTEGTFGPRWLRNISVNVRRLPRLCTPLPGSSPVVIAAPGPSLSEHYDLLRRWRSRYCLLALSSAWKPLLEARIEPDGVIHTDPGYWASRHLAPACSTDTTALFPLTARPYPVCGGSGIGEAAPEGGGRNSSALLLTTGNPLERFLAKQMGLPALSVPAHGSVAGSALYAAEELTTGPIVFAGLDLSFADIRSHVRGHSFDSILLARSSRLTPPETLYYARSSRSDDPAGEAARRSLSAYASWFERRGTQGRTFCLTSSSEAVFSPLKPDDFSSLLSNGAPTPVWGTSDFNGGGTPPPEHGIKALAELRLRLEEELRPLLLSAEDESSSGSRTGWRSYLSQHPLSESFLAMADRSALLQLHRREGLRMDTAAAVGRLAEAARTQLTRLPQHTEVKRE